MVLASRPWLSRRELLPADMIAEPHFHDPAWEEMEAVRAEPRKRLTGRMSTLDIAKKSGVVFCLDVDHTTYEPRTRAARVRILAAGDGGTSRPLGEVPVHEDGSFMAEVPADVALGFEALDEAGTSAMNEPSSCTG